MAEDRDRRVVPLDAVRADGWFEELGQGTPNFDELCRLIGERFVAFAVLAGVRITAITVDRRSPDASLIDFHVGDEDEEHRLALGEFRRRLAATLLADEPTPEELGDEARVDEIQAYIGFRYVLLAPLFGIRMLELRSGGPDEPTVILELNDRRDEVTLEEFRELIRERIRGEVQKTRQTGSPFSIDLSAIPRAEEASRNGRFAEIIELLGAWPGPLSLLLRTHEGQQLSPDVKATLARALGLLGTAYVKTSRFDWAEEVMRLGIQWGQESAAAGDLFRRLAESFVARDRHGEAIALFRRSLALGAGPRQVLPLLAACYAARGRFVAAAVCIDEATAQGVEATEVAEVRAQVENALGAAWAKFRALVPPPDPGVTTVRPPEAREEG